MGERVHWIDRQFLKDGYVKFSLTLLVTLDVLYPFLNSLKREISLHESLTSLCQASHGEQLFAYDLSTTERKKNLSRSLTGPKLQDSDRPLDASEYLRCAWNFQTPNVEFLSIKIIENKHGCHVGRENPKTPSQIIAGQINKFILFPSSGVYENYR